jgi:hypothetical protein
MHLINFTASENFIPPIFIFSNPHLSGLTWDEDLGAFIEASQVPSHLTPHSCVICGSQSTKRKFETPTLGLGSFSHLGTTYHKLDFIYTLNDQDDDESYIIAQVLGFYMNNSTQTIQVHIRQLEHCDNLAMCQPSASFNWRKDEVCSRNLIIYLSFFADLII